MTEILNQKLDIIKKMYDVTKQAAGTSLDEDTEKYNILINERQKLSEQIDKISKILKETKIDNTKEQIAIKEEINKNINAILKLDESMKEKIKIVLKDSKIKFYEAEKKLATSNYDLEEEDKKPKGYFLNMKG